MTDKKYQTDLSKLESASDLGIVKLFSLQTVYKYCICLYITKNQIKKNL